MTDAAAKAPKREETWERVIVVSFLALHDLQNENRNFCYLVGVLRFWKTSCESLLIRLGF
jgi:hypothetical protein